jgi:hypothetical protein
MPIARPDVSTVLTASILFLSASSARGFEEVWRASFAPSPGGEERGRFVAADTSGNVFVAGIAEDLDASASAEEHTVLIKHSPRGEILWTRTRHAEF